MTLNPKQFLLDLCVSIEVDLCRRSRDLHFVKVLAFDLSGWPGADLSDIGVSGASLFATIKDTSWTPHFLP